MELIPVDVCEDTDAVEFLTPGLKALPSAGLASAKFVHPDELELIDHDEDVLYLSNESEGSKQTLGLRNDFHTLLVGGTRAGKGASLIVNNLLLRKGSAFVLDFKGELATITARRRSTGSTHAKGMGQTVHILDPYCIAGRTDDQLEDLQAQYNPLDDMNGDDPFVIDLVNEVASAMIVTTNQNGDATYWLQAARSLLKETIAHVLTSNEFDPEARNLVTVYRLLCFGDQEKRAFLEELGVDVIPKAHALLFSSMKANPAFEGMIEAAGETYGQMLSDAPKQYLGVIETLKSNLEFIDSPGVQECLLASSFSMKELKESPEGVSVYLCLPFGQMEVQFRWLRVMLATALNTMERQRFKPKSCKSVLMVLDEFAALKKLPALQGGIAQMAGFGVEFMLAVQDLSQLKSVYGDAWETFIGNCGNKLFLGSTDLFTANYVSKLIGEAELRVSSITQGSTTNYSETHGLTITRGTTRTDSRTTAIGTTSQTNRGDKFVFRDLHYGSGEGTSYVRTTGSSDGTSKSRAENDSKTIGRTSSFSEQLSWQTRPLVRPEEVGRLFAYRKPLYGKPHAGQTLLLVAGEYPTRIKRTLYHRHVRFAGLYDPTDDHPIRAPYRPPWPRKDFPEHPWGVPLPEPVPEPVYIPLSKPPLPPAPILNWKQRLRRWLWKEFKLTIKVGNAAMNTRLSGYLFWLPLEGVLIGLLGIKLSGFWEEAMAYALFQILTWFPFLIGEWS